MSSDESGDPRALPHLWCRGCNHLMHSLSHCKRHFTRSGHQKYGIHCGCCDKTFAWSEVIGHLNQKGAHKRQSVVTVPPPPRTSTPDSSCTIASSPRYHPYRGTVQPRPSPSASRRPVGPGDRQDDPYLTSAWNGSQAAEGAPPTSPPSNYLNTGFGVPRVPIDNTALAHQVGLGYGLPPDMPSSPISQHSQLPQLHIPSASFATHFATQSQPVLPLSAYQASVYSIDSSTTAASAIASPSVSSINTDDFLLGLPLSPSTDSLSCYLNDTSMATPTTTTGSGRSSVATPIPGVHTLLRQQPTSFAVSPAATTTSTSSAQDTAPLTDRQLLQIAMGQLLWTYGIIETHVRHTDPLDVADSMGRLLLQAQDHWLLPIPGAMRMPLTELVQILRPIWSHLYYSRQ